MSSRFKPIETFEVSEEFLKYLIYSSYLETHRENIFKKIDFISFLIDKFDIEWD